MGKVRRLHMLQTRRNTCLKGIRSRTLPNSESREHGRINQVRSRTEVHKRFHAFKFNRKCVDLRKTNRLNGQFYMARWNQPYFHWVHELGCGQSSPRRHNPHLRSAQPKNWLLGRCKLWRNRELHSLSEESTVGCQQIARYSSAS
jgi:hypothetical protein